MDKELFTKNSTNCKAVMEKLCERDNLNNTVLCEGLKTSTNKYSTQICGKIESFALKNEGMIQRRTNSKNVNQLSGIIAQHISLGSTFKIFQKEEQRFLERSTKKILSILDKPTIIPMRRKFETVEDMLLRMQKDILLGNGKFL